MTYSFVTNTVIPIEAFTTFGINAKPNSANPIGYFGTGLKYAVAIVLRLGGNFRLLIDGAEYQFYLSSSTFRGKYFDKVRMKKRNDLFSKWRYEALPFTTELGKNWELWQAFRELESNTRDENGWSGMTEPSSHSASKGRTIIEIDCEGFEEAAKAENEVFLDKSGPKIFENGQMTIYDAPSKYLYYRGVRVYDLRYPSRFTYEFKQGQVNLSEDRTARNSFHLFWLVSSVLMTEIRDKSLIYKALNKSNNEEARFFEGHDLPFSAAIYGVSDEFRHVANRLNLKGFATASVTGVVHMLSPTPKSEAFEKVELAPEEWDVVVLALQKMHDDEESAGIGAPTFKDVMDKIKEQIS